jgi:hypothetical protein
MCLLTPGFLQHGPLILISQSTCILHVLLRKVPICTVPDSCTSCLRSCSEHDTQTESETQDGRSSLHGGVPVPSSGTKQISVVFHYINFSNHISNTIKVSFRFVSFRSPSLFYLLVQSGCRAFLFSLDHTQTHTTVGRTIPDEGSARRRD